MVLILGCNSVYLFEKSIIIVSVYLAHLIWLSSNLFFGHADLIHRSERCWLQALSVEPQPEWATLAVTDAANRRCPHRDCCTPAILAYSASFSNSIYHSNPFQSLSYIFPAERQWRQESLKDVGRCCMLEGIGVCACVLLGVRNKTLYILECICWKRPWFH